MAKIELDLSNLPSNNKTQPQVEIKEKKVVESVVMTKATVKKETLVDKAKSLVMGHGREIATYIVLDVLIPAIKDTIVDSVEIAVYGQKKNRRPSGGTGYQYGTYTPYNQYSNTQQPQRRPTGPQAPISNERPTWDRLEYSTKPEAQDVLNVLIDIIMEYGSVNVADLYSASGLSDIHTDHNYGWYDLSTSGIERVRGGWRLILPRPVLLK